MAEQVQQDKKQQEQKIIQQCRYYEQEFPKEDDLVVVEVTAVDENSIAVVLLEYNRQEGMLTPNELTKPLSQHFHKALKVGKQEVTRVLRVDQKNCCVDLSKKKITKSEETICLDRFAKSKQVNSLMLTVADKSESKLEEIYQEIVYPLAKKHGHALQGLTLALNDEKIITTLKTSEKNKELLFAQIRLRLTPKTLQIRCEFELISYDFLGVEIIKQALEEAEKVSEQNCAIKFHILGSPLYSGQINTSNKNLGLDKMKRALEILEEKITESGGIFKLKSEPKASQDTKELNQNILNQAEEAQGSGDSEESEVEGMGDASDEEQKDEDN